METGTAGDLEDLREEAEAAQRLAGPERSRWNNGRLHPAHVLVLLDRIEALERKVSEWQLATRCGAPVDAWLLRRVAMEVAANMCTNIEDARRIRESAGEVLRP